MEKNEEMKSEQITTKTLAPAMQKSISDREGVDQSPTEMTGETVNESPTKFYEKFRVDFKPAEMLMGVILPGVSDQLKRYQEMKKLNQK